jgi:hypothetical protein
VYNEVNCRPDHQCADLVEAFPAAETPAQVFFPYLQYNSFTRESDPPFIFWNGKGTSLILTSIRKDGNNIRFTVAEVGDGTPPGAVTLAKDVHQDAAIIQWKASDTSYKGPSVIRWGPSGKEMQEAEVQPYGQGRYTYTIEGLSAKTAYSVELLFRNEGVDGKVTEEHFTTKSIYGSQPCIYINNSMKNSDGSFYDGAMLPLRIYNCPEAESVRWFFDGRHVTTGEDGYYHITRSGLLKAEITLSDGSKEIITRKLELK